MLLFWCSVAKLCLTLWNPRDCSTPGFLVLHYLLEFAQTRVHWVGDIIQPYYALLAPFPPSLDLSQISVFSSELALRIRWPKYWSFNFSISPSNEYPGLIFFRIYWFDLAVQGTLKSFLQHHNSKASIPWHSDFFMVQLSHPYMTTGKTTALTIQTFVSKVMSLFFSTLKFVIAFLPRSKCLLFFFFCILLLFISYITLGKLFDLSELFFFLLVVNFVIHWNETAMGLHVFTCDPPSHLPLHPLPLGLPSAPGLSACLMHPTWAGDL